MNALYRNRLYKLVDTSGDIALLADEQRELTVRLGSEELVIDPTDAQVACAENLSTWYGVQGQAADDLRDMLRGTLSIAKWQSQRKG